MPILERGTTNGKQQASFPLFFTLHVFFFRLQREEAGGYDGSEIEPQSPLPICQIISQALKSMEMSVAIPPNMGAVEIFNNNNNNNENSLKSKCSKEWDINDSHFPKLQVGTDFYKGTSYHWFCDFALEMQCRKERNHLFLPETLPRTDLRSLDKTITITNFRQ